MCSCATLKKLGESTLESDYYKEYPRSGGTKIYLNVSEDSLAILSTTHPQASAREVMHGQIFFKDGFDIDVMTCRLNSGQLHKTCRVN